LARSFLLMRQRQMVITATYNVFPYRLELLYVWWPPDSHRLASGSIDTTVRLWDAETGQPIGQALTGHTDTVFSVAFSPDGQRLASGSADNTARLWPVTATPQMLCSKLTANMSHKQWRDWVCSDIGYIPLCPGLPTPDGGTTGQT
jgi:WD40 repeat protein